MELRERGDLETAAATFSELLERCPTYIPAYLHYGTVLSQLSREEQASSIFRQGMEVSLQGGEQHAYEELHSALEQLTGEE
jgi:Tfp pilus assembly protein PilF